MNAFTPTDFFEEAAEPILIVAATSSGKGVELVIPEALNWGGRLVVHDPKDKPDTCP